MDQLIKYLPLIGIPSIFVLATYIIKSISLLKTSAIEKVLLTDQQKLTAFALQILFSSLLVAIIVVTITVSASPQVDLNYVITLFIISFITSSIGIPIWVSALKTFLKRTYFYIQFTDPETKELTIYYILKVTFGGEVLLGKNRYLNDTVILIKKDDLYKVNIYHKKY